MNKKNMSQENKKGSSTLNNLEKIIRKVVRQELEIFMDELKDELQGKSSFRQSPKPDEEHVISNSSENDSDIDWKEKYGELHESMEKNFKMDQDRPSNFNIGDSEEIVDENNKKFRIDKSDPAYQKVMSKINKNYKNFF